MGNLQIFNGILPEFANCSHFLDDLVQFLDRILLKCKDLKGDVLSRDVEKTKTGEISPYNTGMVYYALRKFILPLLKNHAQVLTDLGEPSPIAKNKPVKR